MKALEKDRRRRYETANDFAADVMRYLTDQPVEACPPSAWYRFRKFARRNRAALTTAVLVGVALDPGTAVSTWQADRGRCRGRRATAQHEADEGHGDQRVPRSHDLLDAGLSPRMTAVADQVNLSWKVVAKPSRSRRAIPRHSLCIEAALSIHHLRRLRRASEPGSMSRQHTPPRWHLPAGEGPLPPETPNTMSRARADAYGQYRRYDAQPLDGAGAGVLSRVWRRAPRHPGRHEQPGATCTPSSGKSRGPSSSYAKILGTVHVASTGEDIRHLDGPWTNLGTVYRLRPGLDPRLETLRLDAATGRDHATRIALPPGACTGSGDN